MYVLPTMVHFATGFEVITCLCNSVLRVDYNKLIMVFCFLHLNE